MSGVRKPLRAPDDPLLQLFYDACLEAAHHVKMYYRAGALVRVGSPPGQHELVPGWIPDDPEQVSADLASYVAQVVYRRFKQAGVGAAP